MNPWALSAIQGGYAASLAPSWLRFNRAAADPERAQLARLKTILRANAGSAFGRARGFERMDSLAAYQSTVPVCHFDELAPWVERIAGGEQGVLSSEPVLMMERTSGSTTANKLVPFTKGLLDEIGSATHPWLFDLFRRCPGLWGTRSYWSISPATRTRELTQGGIPVGIEDDTEYFGPLGRWALAGMMTVPSTVAAIADVERWRWETCRHLLGASDLGLISVWSPTFLTLLMEWIEASFEDLLASVPRGRAQEIRQALQARGELTGEVLWPRLALVSCWCDGPSRAMLEPLRRWFPRTPLQPKGLLATEGVVSFPLWGQEGAVLAVAGHFLEFMDVEHPTKRPLLAHELREGALVSPILTTSGGLYRYHLQDVIRCVGRYRGTPCVRFEGRLDCVSDLVGEKLDARVVGAALESAMARCGTRWAFAMLAPEATTPPAYHLYLEGGNDANATVMAREVEALLAEGAHYGYSRKLGQLGAVKAVRVQGGAKALERRRAMEGGKIGQLKPSPLDRRSGWMEYFRDL